MNASPVSARLLDVSRLVSRAGRVPTGIDRVELAYLREILRRETPAFGLARTPLGFVLLDQAGLEGLEARIAGRAPWGKADRLSRAFGKLDEAGRRAISDLRRLALARTHRAGLARLLRRHLPEGFAYLNVGHSNINDRVFHAVRYGAKGRIVAMIHDTIPLDFPLYQTPDSVRRFGELLRKVRAGAGLVIYNSQATRERAERHMAEWGTPPKGVVAHLGVDLAAPDAAALPKGMPPDAPYFLTVGTIEPRKNHMLLLEIWERLVKQTTPQEMPHLILAGTRGWKNEELFYRMDHSGLMGEYIHEYAGLSDGAVRALLDGAAGVLFPSVAEGYGLPAIEAAAAGVPLICADLPVYREVLKDIPVYASLKDSYLWQRRITTLARGGQTARRTDAEAFEAPDWTQHFNKVFRLT